MVQNCSENVRQERQQHQKSFLLKIEAGRQESQQIHWQNLLQIEKRDKIQRCVFDNGNF